MKLFVGELSKTVFGEDSKKLSWASELFEQGTHQLKEQTYLGLRAWNPQKYPGPYGYSTYLAEVEALLIGLVYEAYPNQLLNHKRSRKRHLLTEENSSFVLHLSESAIVIH